ncbi:hypothetical protein UJ101_01055 [Flavobacteriaceae bacterium UJ101]|nr:hypothetical protein UJ101_01055 [Flavobacteriaceae bacterium UJ101]
MITKSIEKLLKLSSSDISILDLKSWVDSYEESYKSIITEDIPESILISNHKAFIEIYWKVQKLVVLSDKELYFKSLLDYYNTNKDNNKALFYWIDKYSTEYCIVESDLKLEYHNTVIQIQPDIFKYNVEFNKIMVNELYYRENLEKLKEYVKAKSTYLLILDQNKMDLLGKVKLERILEELKFLINNNKLNDLEVWASNYEAYYQQIINSKLYQAWLDFFHSSSRENYMELAEKYNYYEPIFIECFVIILSYNLKKIKIAELNKIQDLLH